MDHDPTETEKQARMALAQVKDLVALLGGTVTLDPWSKDGLLANVKKVIRKTGVMMLTLVEPDEVDQLPGCPNTNDD